MNSDFENIVTENINLVYHMLQKLGYYHNLDEYEDIAMIGLVKGAKSYDKSKGIALSTYLGTCIKNEVYNHSRIQTFQKRNNGILPISLSTIISIDNQKDIELQDILKSDENVLNKVIKKMLIEDILKEIRLMNSEKQFIINSYYGINGYEKLNQIQIAKKLNTSQTNICRFIKKFINKMKEKYEVKK